MRSPVVWLGGKSRLAPKLNALLPVHHSYVEVFGGGASLLFYKRPSPVEVYNDRNAGLVNFLRVLRDPRKKVWLRRKLSGMPYSRAEYNHFRATWEQTEGDVERAFRWFSVMRMSFGSQFGQSWGYSRFGTAGGMAECVHRFRAAAALLDEAQDRLTRVLVECRDWREILATFDRADTFFYCDPPYVPETRRSGGYAHELELADHVDLVDRLLGLQGRAMLSGYAHPVYARLEEAGWRRVDFAHRCCLDNRHGRMTDKQARTESVWMNYEDTNGDAKAA